MLSYTDTISCTLYVALMKLGLTINDIHSQQCGSDTTRITTQKQSIKEYKC